MKEKVKLILEKSRIILKKVGLVSLLIITILLSFSGGILYHRETTPIKMGIEMIHVNKSDVNLALDENNHLLVIDKKSGDYTIYDDSIGVSIFKIYARNIKLNE